jgi:hypothetical protein
MTIVRTRYPGYSVVLFKNVGRSTLNGQGALPASERYSGQNSIRDVTQFVGERGLVLVNKSVHEAAGAFRIEFADKLVQDAADDLYGLFEPMDMVEIRMTGNAYKTLTPPPVKIGSGQILSAPGFDADPAPTLPGTQTATTPAETSKMPIMMRGFISQVGRSQGIGSDGKPTRKVTISGQDYGKIWQIDHIYFNPWMPDNNNYITQFKFFAQFGLAFQAQPAGQLISSVFSRIINQFITNMQGNSGNTRAGSKSPLVTIGTSIQTQGGSVSPFGVGDWQGGSLFSLLNTYGDVGAWNELFIDDLDKGPTVIYRANPFIVAGGDPADTGSYIQPMKQDFLPVISKISSNDIISMDVARTDSNVANYFWVEAPQYDVNFSFLGKAMAEQGGDKSTFVITNDGNLDSALYGFKRMEEKSYQMGGISNSGNGTPKSVNNADSNVSLTWISQRRKDLVNQNRDNVVFESGSIRIVGNETVRAGTYLQITHGNMTSNYYVPSVSHSYSPFGAYVTTAQVERGTGFIDRAQRGAGQQSPYLSELADALK